MAVWRLEFSARWVAAAATICMAVIAALAVGSLSWALHQRASLDALRDAKQAQIEQLQALDRQTSRLDDELRRLQKQNTELRGLIGAPSRAPAAHPEEHALSAQPAVVVAAHLFTLQRAAAAEAERQRGLRDLTLHVLNLRHLAIISRARLLAAIPSITPVQYVAVGSTFGWRTDPWPEFHKGLDLDAEYGAPVRATAAGTVVAAGYDGGFGIRVEIDHHNGYQTWYAHLRQADVKAGDDVTKGKVIGAVGMTGETTGPHVHYQLMKDGAPIDPAPFINGVPARVLAALK
jgi:murein DD-endopeptidase MepM/ murein hydrolase activator NlpD